MELEQASFNFKPVVDQRGRAPEPLPVRLVAVADMRVNSPAGRERELDAFYVALLGMERMGGGVMAYRTENFDLYIDVIEPPVVREDYRPVRAEVKSRAGVEMKLIEAGIAYVRRKGLVPGDEALVLQDPAGNWVEITEVRVVG